MVIPCSTSTTESIAIVFWMLAREVLTLRGQLDQADDDWTDVLVDLFYYKDVSEARLAQDAQPDQEGDREEGSEEEPADNNDWNETNN